MAFTYDQYKHILLDVFHKDGSVNVFNTRLLFDEDSDERYTQSFYSRFLRNVVHIGVHDEFNSDCVSFFDMVGSVIDLEHELCHSNQYVRLISEKNLSFVSVDLLSKHDSYDYFKDTYFSSVAEVDAEIYGLNCARLYLHNKYNGHEDAIDRHILGHGNLWFSGVDGFCNFDSLDSLLDWATNYRDSLYKDQPVYHYDDYAKSNDLLAVYFLNHPNSYKKNEFESIANGVEQRYIAMNVVVSEKSFLRDRLPSLKRYFRLDDRYAGLTDDIVDSEHDDFTLG